MLYILILREGGVVPKNHLQIRIQAAKQNPKQNFYDIRSTRPRRKIIPSKTMDSHSSNSHNSAKSFFCDDINSLRNL